MLRTPEPPATGALALEVKQMAARYAEVRRETERICLPLSAEDCQVQSMPDCSPTKWHLAHTSWFFETFVLQGAVPGYRPFHPRYSHLFNSYYVTVGDRHARPRRGLLSRPGLDEVRRYRAHVDRQIGELLGGGALDRLREYLPVLELGLHHEQQHQELILTDIKHVFGQSPLRPVYRAAAPAAVAEPLGPLRFCEVQEGLREIGCPPGAGFCFDNEGPRHRAYVPGFRLASRLVSCGEYLEFMEAGGYRRPELWLSDGWDFVQREGTPGSCSACLCSTTS